MARQTFSGHFECLFNEHRLLVGFGRTQEDLQSERFLSALSALTGQESPPCGRGIRYPHCGVPNSNLVTLLLLGTHCSLGYPVTWSPGTPYCGAGYQPCWVPGEPRLCLGEIFATHMDSFDNERNLTRTSNLILRNSHLESYTQFDAQKLSNPRSL